MSLVSLVSVGSAKMLFIYGGVLSEMADDADDDDDELSGTLINM
jgi:hypothetical protein